MNIPLLNMTNVLNRNRDQLDIQLYQSSITNEKRVNARVE